MKRNYCALTSDVRKSWCGKSDYNVFSDGVAGHLKNKREEVVLIKILAWSGSQGGLFFVLFFASATVSENELKEAQYLSAYQKSTVS